MSTSSLIILHSVKSTYYSLPFALIYNIASFLLLIPLNAKRPPFSEKNGGLLLKDHASVSPSVAEILQRQKGYPPFTEGTGASKSPTRWGNW